MMGRLLPTVHVESQRRPPTDARGPLVGRPMGSLGDEGSSMPEPLAAASVNEYWTAEQLAEMLQVSAKSVFRWASADASMLRMSASSSTINRAPFMIRLAPVAPRATSAEPG